MTAEHDLFKNKQPAWLIAVGAAALVVMTILAYSLTLRAGFIWDDDYYVTENRLLRTWGGLQQIWFDILPNPEHYPLPQYYPMTHTSFWVEYQIWGLNPTGYHLTNVLLHAANALLAWLILRKLAVPGAWLAAAIFAVHPIHVESVAWIAERKNVLSGFFFLAALYIYLRYVEVIPAPERPNEYVALPKEKERVWGLALALFVFALLSKTVTSTFPAVVLLIVWWKRGRLAWKDVVPLLPFFALSIGAGALTSYMEAERVGAVGPDWDYAPTLGGEIAARILIAGKAAWFYVGKLIVPYPLMFNYPRWNIGQAPLWWWIYPLSWVLVLAALVVGIRHVGRGPLAAVLFYLGTLFPALGFINVLPMRYSFVADHFVYLPSLGLVALAAALATWACARYLSRPAQAGGAPAAAAAAVLLVFFLLTLLQTRMYANEATLWAETWKRSDKQSWIAANNYGGITLARSSIAPREKRADLLAAAEQWFNTAIQLKPDHAEAHYNLGLIAERRGNRDRAIEMYRKSLEHRPNYELPMYRLAVIAQAEGRLAEAEELLRRIMELNPHDANARLTLGLLMEEQGKFQEALDLYQAASDIDPTSASPYISAGNVLMKQGHPEEAMARWAEASRLEPTNPMVSMNVGAIFAASGYLEEARILFERAIRLDPTLSEAHRQLGVVLAMQGKKGEALEHLELAVKLDPDSERAKSSLASFREGRIQPATTQAATQPATRDTTVPAPPRG